MMASQRPPETSQKRQKWWNRAKMSVDRQDAGLKVEVLEQIRNASPEEEAHVTPSRLVN
jgi:hypothetical protein